MFVFVSVHVFSVDWLDVTVGFGFVLFSVRVRVRVSFMRSLD